MTGTKANVKISENCKLIADWDAAKPDENVEHYKAKLRELYDKFKPWIELAKNRSKKISAERRPGSVLFVRSGILIDIAMTTTDQKSL